MIEIVLYEKEPFNLSFILFDLYLALAAKVMLFNHRSESSDSIPLTSSSSRAFQQRECSHPLLASEYLSIFAGSRTYIGQVVNFFP